IIGVKKKDKDTGSKKEWKFGRGGRFMLERQPTIAVDFDGVISEHCSWEYTGKPGGIQGVTMRLRTRNGGSRMTYIRFLGSACVVLLLVAAAVAQESYDQVLHHWDYDKNTPLNIKQAGIEE